MINPDHKAWPDLRRESEIVRLVDHRLNEALDAVAMTRTELITSREWDLIKAVGEYATQAEAGRQIGNIASGTVGVSLSLSASRLPEDNKYVKLFNTSATSLVYASGHEGSFRMKQTSSGTNL